MTHKREAKTTTQERVREILREHLVLPILKLKETHPQYSITEKGYKKLVAQALSAIQEAYKLDEGKVENLLKLEYGKGNIFPMVSFGGEFIEIKSNPIISEKYFKDLAKAICQGMCINE